jgi:acyl-CoA synthetase (NDP forming)
LTETHQAQVKSTLGPLVAVANPLDYHTFIWNNEPQMTTTFMAMVSGGFDLNMLVLDFPRVDRCSDAGWWTAVNAFEKALKATGARGAIVASMLENLPEDHAAELLRRGIVPFHGIVEALDAAEAAASIGEAWKRGLSAPLQGVPAKRTEGLASEGTPKASSASGPTPPGPSGHPPLKGEGTLDEAAAKATLEGAGLPVPQGRRAATPDEAVRAAASLGFPVALKALGIAHKSEHGALRLNLRDAEAVHAAARDLAGLGSGLYVERMVTGGVAELIVGITRDPLFGPMMTIGSGGVLVELLKDSATLLLPATRADVEMALKGLRMFPLLTGYRGRPTADLEAAIDAILGIAEFAVGNAASIEELDVNPLIVCAEGEGAWIADALLVLSSPLEGEVPAKRAEGVASEGTAMAPRASGPTPPGPSGHPPLKGEGKVIA